MHASDALTPHAAALSTTDSDPFNVLFEHSPQPLLIVDEVGRRVVAANAAALRLYGYGRVEMLGLALTDIEVTPDGADGAEAMGGRAGARVAAHRRKGGGLVEVEITAAPMTFAGRPAQLLRLGDLGERRRWHDLIERVERTEVMSRLTGMVAHDFGNLLSVINGYADLIAERLDPRDPLRADVEEVRRAGESGVALTRQLLAFSRRAASQPQYINLNMHVAGARALLGRFLGEQIDLVVSLAEDAGNVEMDPVQLQQVILNLVVNARDAMPSGGRLCIETENVTLDGDSARRHFNLGAGEYVMLAVSDTGLGMDAETQRRAFEPFYTTKPVDRGTGLGLAIVHDIIEQQAGGIYVYSIAGVGTTFKIYLPRVFADTDAGAATGVGDWPKGTETILLVEDEESVRLVVRHALEAHGYTVLEAASGRDALAICGGAQPIHLVISDVMMPRMGGIEMAAELRALRPQSRLLLMSGYAGDHLTRFAGLGGADAYLQKPILPGPLLCRVREMLDQPANWRGVAGLSEHALMN